MKGKMIPWKKLWPVVCAVVLIVGALWTGEMEARYPTVQTENSVFASRSTSAAGSAKLEAVMMDSAAMDNGASFTMGAAAPVQQESRKIVRTADLTIRTQTFDECSQAVQQALEEMGGYIEHLYQYGESVRRLTLSMRVPSARLDEFLHGLEGAGRVTDRSESTTDMTVQYQDNQARLNTLYEKRDRLNVLLSQAQDVSDLIEIESAIADTQYQIDSFENSQRRIDSQVDMSAVNVTILEETPSDTANADVTLMERIRAGFSASIEWLGEFLRDLVVFVVMIAPVAVPLAVILLVIRLIRKRKGK